MIDYLDIRAIYHSSFSEEEKARRKAELKPLNRDFLMDLPSQVHEVMDQLYWSYKDQPWFEEAWEKYRKHVLDAGLGGKIKMPGFVFNEYIDRYIDEQEKKMKKELVHMDTCDIDELYHHGIKGQKWGLRRFQNDDGTLTEEGKKRYGVDSNGNMSKEGSAKYREDRQKSLEAAKKDIRERDLNVKWFTKSADANRERLKLSKKYIEEKYGKQTAKDLYNQELKKELIAGGAALVAAAGVMTISIFNTIKR